MVRWRWVVVAAVGMAACGRAGVGGGSAHIGSDAGTLPGSPGGDPEDGGATGGAGNGGNGAPGSPDGGFAGGGLDAGAAPLPPIDGGTAGDGGTLACIPEGGPGAASCAELVPGPLGTLEKYRYLPNQDQICGRETVTNGEGSFVEVDQRTVDSLPQDIAHFVSPSGEVVATVPQEASAWPDALAGGFLIQRYTPPGPDYAWTVAWYTSSGSEMASPVVVRPPETVAAAAIRPGGTGSAILVTSEDRTSGFRVLPFDAQGHPLSAGGIPLPDSANVRGESFIGFDSIGNLLVAVRETFRDRYNTTPERWAEWWVGPDGVPSERLDLFGSRLTDAGLLLEGVAPLADGRLAVDTYDGEQHAWRWTVSRTGGLQPVPCWLADRPDSLVQWIRGGRGYLVSQDSVTQQRIEIMTTTGESCGRLRDYCPACENGWIFTTVVGLDGTLSYLPDPNFELDAGTCGTDWYPGAFR